MGWCLPRRRGRAGHPADRAPAADVTAERAHPRRVCWHQGMVQNRRPVQFLAHMAARTGPGAVMARRMGFPAGRRGKAGRAGVMSLDLMPKLGQYPPRVSAHPPAQGRAQRPGSHTQCQPGVDPDPARTAWPWVHRPAADSAGDEPRHPCSRLVTQGPGRWVELDQPLLDHARGDGPEPRDLAGSHPADGGRAVHDRFGDG